MGLVMSKKLKLVFSGLCGVAVFVGFMMLLGNPHRDETLIGLCLGAGTFLGVQFMMRSKNK